MKKRISRRDWQRLSAYIDEQLTPNQQKRIEARLEIEPALQSTLDDVHLMKLNLGALPKLPAPRNFTLTPEMAAKAGQKRRAVRLYSALRLASAISSLLFVLVFLGDVFSFGSVGFTPASQDLALPAAERSAGDIQDIENLELPVMEVDADVAVGTNAEDLDAGAEATQAAEPSSVGAVTDAEVAQDTDAEAQEMSADAEKIDAEESDAEESEALEQEGLAEAESIEMEDDEIKADPSATEGETVPPAELADQFASDTDIPQADTASLHLATFLEIILLLIAIITGLMAFSLRRRGRS